MSDYKECPMCGDVKHIDDFRYRTSSVSGYCMPCRKDYEKGVRNERNIFNIKTRVKYVAELIFSMKFEPGDILLPERELSIEIGISRGALREAILVMEYLGYITGGHGKPRRIAKCLTGLIS